MSEHKARLAFRSHMGEEGFYAMLDPGIRFAVRVLHAHGIETGQSCEGGKGHSYAEPTVDLWGFSPSAAVGFAALHYLEEYGLRVVSVAMVWNVQRGLVHENLWRIVLAAPCPERADEQPQFVWGYER